MTDEVKNPDNGQNSANTQPNDPQNNQAHDHSLPPLRWPDKSPDPHDPYDYITTDVPTEQTILIHLNHAQAGYLPHAATVDEAGHIVPADVYNRQTHERVLPIAFMRQGEASGVTFKFRILDFTGPVDLSDFHNLHFEGRTSQNNYVNSDIGFDTTQMSIGEFTWSPEEAVGLVSGKFVSAHITINKQDGTERSISLDFDLHIIPNDVAFPRPMAFYLSEYQRGLANLKKMQDLADEHIGYSLDFFDQAITDALLENEKRINEALTEFEDKLSIEDQKLKDLDSSFQQLQQKEADFETALQNKLTDLIKQMDQKNLVTQDKMVSMFQDAIKSGDINIECEIEDADIRNIIDSWAAGNQDIYPPAAKINISDIENGQVNVEGN